MALVEFIDNYNGSDGVGDTPENRGECVGLVEAWFDYVGSPHVWGNGAQLLDNADTNAYRVVYNTPDGEYMAEQPQAGDVLVWGECNDISVQTGPYGHTAIFVSGDINSVFTSFDQNFPTGSACHLQQHTYHGVKGWLHPSALDTVPAPAAPEAPVDTPVAPDPVVAPVDPAPSETPSQPAPDAPVDSSTVDPPQSPTVTSPAPIVTPVTENIMSKFLSRKFILTVLGVVAAISAYLAGALSANVSLTSATFLIGLYNVIEGLIDHKSAQ